MAYAQEFKRSTNPTEFVFASFEKLDKGIILMKHCYDKFSPAISAAIFCMFQNFI